VHIVGVEALDPDRGTQDSSGAMPAFGDGTAWPISCRITKYQCAA